MNASDNVIDVNEADFEYEVLTYSQNVPVVVDFWAPWCIPCKTLGPMLERLAQEAHGAFRLARVNVDENPNLAMRYSVRSIPNVKAFRQGQVVAEFSGVQPEGRIREFLRQIAPSPADLTIEKGLNLLHMHQWAAAEMTFRQASELAPDNPAGLLGLAKSILAQGRGHEALLILRSFPASKEYSTAEMLRPLAEAIGHLEQGKLEGDEPLDAAFRNTIGIVRRGNIPAALDGLLDILRQDKRYRSGLPRLVVLGLLELLGEADPQTREYRSELASILF